MLNDLILSDNKLIFDQILENSISLIITDPPYQISKKSNFSKSKKENKYHNKYKKHNIDYGDWDKADIDWKFYFEHFYRMLNTNGQVIMFCDVYKIGQLKEIAESVGFKQPRVCVWVKCISGSTEIYVMSKDNVSKKMYLKDIYRHKNKKDLKVWDGYNWSNIIDVYKNNDNDKILKIQLRGGEIIKSTTDHIFKLECDTELLASDLKIGNTLMSCLIPESIPKSDLSMISDEFFWFIGLYLAEGSRSNKKMQITSHINEQNRIEKIEKICSQYGAYYHVYRKPNTNSMTINVSSNIISVIVDRYIVGNTSHSKHFSQEFWNLTNQKIKIVLDSYLDADASFDQKNNRYGLRFSGENYQLEKDLRTISNRLGLRIKLNRKNVLNTNTGKKHMAFIGNLYINSDVNYAEIISIDYIDRNKDSFYDISVDSESHLFSLSSGILVHNCNPTPVNSNSNYLSNAKEFIISLTKKEKPIFNSKYDDGIYRIPKLDRWESVSHPTQKPIKLMEELIQKHSNIDSVILDPFCGSGTTLVAANNLGRKWIGIDSNPEYINICKLRLNI